MGAGKSEAGFSDSDPGSRWPRLAVGVATAGLIFHFGAVLTTELGASPSSPLERWAASVFAPYASALNLDHAHRYYAPAPPPTPVVKARLRFADGRPERVVRLPDPSTWPRIRYQRQLALAYHLYADATSAREAGMKEGYWAASYARHLCRANPGCTEVALSGQLHLFPAMQRLRDAASDPDAVPLDLDGDEFFSTPEQIGVYSCDEP